MTPKTTREKWLLATLPAVLTLLIGWVAFTSPARQQAEALRLRVEKQGPLSTRKALIAQVKTECAALQHAISQKRAAAVAEMGGFDRNRAMQQVSLLCAQHGLSLDATAPDGAMKLPAALQEAAAAVSHPQDGTTPPQVWRIELSGAYDGVVSLLQGLQQSRPLIVPLSLSMETGKTERQPVKWVLTLWL